MTLVLELIKVAGKTSIVLQDALLIVGAFAAALETNFLPYIQLFLPYLYPALKVHKVHQPVLFCVSLHSIGGPEDLTFGLPSP
ncbi:hypothetical protein DFH08DRAFT_1000343 [Mycena albidolilacea]|uniref:Importin subunit beta-1/Transportin-1-like TPR repeats domain-containing protein n=1 Tax=Mycena albidolilacea TaxID=1033008 RepID=A0AAD7A2V7_9AGAR|nr:hypothetical protein DFH08DRAFT_1000343 [Mycena albidolilacea]